MTRRQFLSLIVLVLLGVTVSQFLQNSRPLGRDVSKSASAARILQDKSSPESVRGKGELKVVMFTDYQCPACRRADPALRRAVARDGNVRIVYKDWPIFGERSERAATIALAAPLYAIQSVESNVARILCMSEEGCKLCAGDGSC